MRLFLLFVILFLTTGYTFSQSFKGGITAGVVTSQVDGDSWAGYNKSGFLFGAFVNREFTEKLGATMEIRYIRKGALHDNTKDIPYPASNDYYKSRLNYVEIPVLGRYHVNRFIFEAGPSLGVLVNSKEEDLDGEVSYEQRVDFNQIELSGLAGFTYVVTDDINISFRMQYSLLPVYTRISDDVNIQYRWQKYAFNNLISFSAYYFL